MLSAEQLQYPRGDRCWPKKRMGVAGDEARMGPCERVQPTYPEGSYVLH